MVVGVELNRGLSSDAKSNRISSVGLAAKLNADDDAPTEQIEIALFFRIDRLCCPDNLQLYQISSYATYSP